MGLDVDKFGNLVSVYDEERDFFFNKDEYFEIKKMVSEIKDLTESLEKDLRSVRKKAKATDVYVEIYKEEVDKISSEIISINVLSREIANRMKALTINQLPF